MITTLPPENEETLHCLRQIQQDLFDFGAELHVPERIAIKPDKITWLETRLETMNRTMPPLKEFLLPGGNPASAAAHIARTVCRRAERSLVRLHRQITLANPEMLRYLNRLSDLLFVIARLLGRMSTKQELMWEKTDNRGSHE
jgi:cob(I)alamin adenosyltransferase